MSKIDEIMELRKLEEKFIIGVRKLTNKQIRLIEKRRNVKSKLVRVQTLELIINRKLDEIDSEIFNAFHEGNDALVELDEGVKKDA